MYIHTFKCTHKHIHMNTYIHFTYLQTKLHINCNYIYAYIHEYTHMYIHVHGWVEGNGCLKKCYASKTLKSSVYCHERATEPRRTRRQLPRGCPRRKNDDNGATGLQLPGTTVRRIEPVALNLPPSPSTQSS